MRNGSEESNKWSIFGSLGAALAAAVCCLGPLVLVSFGVTGAWIGNLSALEPYRPLFMVVAAGLLGFGFYRVYGQPAQRQPAQRQPTQQDCGDGAECEVPKANRINQLSLWIATVVVVGLFASPYLLSVGLEDASAAQPEAVAVDDSGEGQTDESDVATVTLQIDGMTCGGCARSVQTALMDIDGVDDAEVTYEPPQARVTYDSSKTTVEKLAEATAEVGYPSKPNK